MFRRTYKAASELSNYIYSYRQVQYRPWSTPFLPEPGTLDPLGSIPSRERHLSNQDKPIPRRKALLAVDNMAPTLLSLPPELRLIIYGFAFAELPYLNASKLDHKASGLHILHICRELRNEVIHPLVKCATSRVRKNSEASHALLNKAVELSAPTRSLVDINNKLAAAERILGDAKNLERAVVDAKDMLRLLIGIRNGGAGGDSVGKAGE